ncbi:hypothetical protein [Campylobacter pinnipediorum]|uniref:Lipoprotein n=1 Tax=Campylobacter pinnipediorum subsp. pinnipediorum TaxID=1660067 RepID=A0AAX0LCP4_9BACT|nr:hypothetical protein [Campylobacter pinnipediorum]AQW81490.1 hypothetical protein CPIN17260_1203 [Campylobacter pinnipediorum subsp. pinnipediorum]AQW83118.1 hypothetical protein CPIN17261_1116 [Campylobacter pinnipediorum subsp. pinnipediorum]AQW84685.1 hypothetical protein CPIN17262_1008 [Campylobacter pinnipediorum subsp. pinnipediorum]AQW86287.1 hypothetical protein CPIN18020_1093 [Campylobacter pinnipediorum subsp. caledonicus]OPA71389.1 hypothetical protein BB381_02520 [Campylobacter 
MKKVFYSLFLMIFMFVIGCSDNKTNNINNTNDKVPTDIPISQGETNTTIDENFPPEPVMEKQE